MKFGLPMAASATMLAWGLVEYRDGFEDAGQLEEALANLRWATDYFIARTRRRTSCTARSARAAPTTRGGARPR